MATTATTATTTATAATTATTTAAAATATATPTATATATTKYWGEPYHGGGARGPGTGNIYIITVCLFPIFPSK